MIVMSKDYLPFESVLLIDGNNLIHRNFHAFPFLTAKDGTPTGAVYGTLKMLKKFQEDFNPMLMIFCMDAHRRSFRNELFADYKGHRPETDDLLKPQFALIEEFCRASKLTCVKKDGFEADDLIGSLSYKALEHGYLPYILSGDRDLFQLVNESIKMIYVSSKDGLVIYNEEKVKERYGGLSPKQIIDLKGLQGDTSDNIPGVKGIGEKTAISLLTQYGSLEGIYENIESIKGKRKETLISQKDMAFLSRELATIKCDVEIDLIEENDFSFDYPEVREFLAKLNIVSL